MLANYIFHNYVLYIKLLNQYIYRMYTVVLQYFRLPDMENLELIKNSDCRQDKTSKQMGLQNVLHVDVAIKSYAISP